MKYTIGGDINKKVLANLIVDLNERASGEDKWTITIKKYKSGRSLQQNALWHKWVGMIAEEQGEIFEVMKDYLLGLTFGWHDRKYPDGSVAKVPARRSSDLNVNEFTKLMEQTDYLATTYLNLNLPREENYATR